MEKDLIFQPISLIESYQTWKLFDLVRDSLGYTWQLMSEALLDKFQFSMNEYALGVDSARIALLQRKGRDFLLQYIFVYANSPSEVNVAHSIPIKGSKSEPIGKRRLERIVEATIRLGLLGNGTDPRIYGGAFIPNDICHRNGNILTSRSNSTLEGYRFEGKILTDAEEGQLNWFLRQRG